METEAQDKLALFFKKYNLIQYKKSEIIYRPNETFYQIGFVKTGVTRMYLVDRTGRETTINLFSPIFYTSLRGAMFGENPFYVEAITPVEMWKAPAEETIKFIKSDSGLSYELLKHFLCMNGDLIENCISGDAYSKVALVLSLLARKYSLPGGGKSATIGFKVTHQLIASLAGISRETASIQIKKIEREGIINQKKDKIVINDTGLLKERSIF